MDEETTVVSVVSAEETIPEEPSEMQKLANATPVPPAAGELVTGSVVGKGKLAIYIDLGYGTGLIYGREYLNARDVLKKVHLGDTITAKVISRENEEGYIELSLKEARQAALWREVEEHVKQKTAMELVVKDANKGGLIIDWQGIDGFLPASQLKPEHYPRVEDGDKDKIAQELRLLIGQKLSVTMIGAEPPVRE